MNTRTRQLACAGTDYRYGAEDVMLSVLHIGENFIFLVLYCVLSQKKSSGLWSAYTTKITNCFNTHSISIRAVRRSIMGGGAITTSYPGSLPTPGASGKTLVGAGHVTL